MILPLGHSVDSKSIGQKIVSLSCLPLSPFSDTDPWRKLGSKEDGQHEPPLSFCFMLYIGPRSLWVSLEAMNKYNAVVGTCQCLLNNPVLEDSYSTDASPSTGSWRILNPSSDTVTSWDTVGTAIPDR